jgi:hypothetical protein
MLADDGHSDFDFTTGTTMAANTADSPYDTFDIGTPTGAFRAIAGGAYQRDFTSGVALVNPTSATVSVPLGGSFTDLGGAHVTTAVLAPHTGDLYHAG